MYVYQDAIEALKNGTNLTWEDSEESLLGEGKTIVYSPSCLKGEYVLAR